VKMTSGKGFIGKPFCQASMARVYVDQPRLLVAIGGRIARV
jgi:hypothetical protein